MLGEDEGEPLGLVTQLAPDRALGLRREIPLGEQEIEDPLHGREARRELCRRHLIRPGSELTQPSAGAAEALVHVGLGREEPLGDLADVESAQRPERDGQLRLDGNRVVAADEHHPEEIVADVSLQRRRGAIRDGDRVRVGVLASVLLGEALTSRALAQLPDDVVERSLVQPRRRVVRRLARRGPALERREQRGLDRVLDGLEVMQPHAARQHRHEPAVLVAKPRLPGCGAAQGAKISMTSTPEPGRTSPGHSRATLTASSSVAAETIM